MIVICIWEVDNLIGCESVNWVCARPGNQGGEVFSQWRWGMRRGGRGCCDIHT